MRWSLVLLGAGLLSLAAALPAPGRAAADGFREIQPGDIWQSAPPPPPASPPAVAAPGRKRAAARPLPARPSVHQAATQAAVRTPVGAPALRHTVARGETAYGIARRFGLTIDALSRANGLADPSRIRVGQVLSIPLPGTAAPQPWSPHPVVLLAEPREEGAPAAVVDGGALLILGRREGAWVRATTQSGQEGWLRIGEIQRPDPHPPVTGYPQDRSKRDGPLEAVITEARRYIGVPYVWGGTNPEGVDCSGFVLVVFSRVAPDLPRTSFDLYRHGAHVRTGDLRAGDLVFFTTYTAGPSHVGIYLGDGQFIHGSSGARRVVVTPLRDSYYATRYVGARRLLP